MFSVIPFISIHDKQDMSMGLFKKDVLQKGEGSKRYENGKGKEGVKFEFAEFSL